MTVSGEFEPVQRRQRGCFSALCWGLLTEAVFFLAGAICGALGYWPGPMDGWFIFSIMFVGAIFALIGIPFSILAAVLVLRMG